MLALASCADTDQPSENSSGESASSGKEIRINGNDALTWGNGDYGVVLAHGAAFDAASWQEQATNIAEQGATVIAVEEASSEGINDAVSELRDEGIDNVALMGGSAGADAMLELASAHPELPDQLIALSANSPVENLGKEPKLFIASEDEASADVATQMAESSPGDDNEATIVPGSAHAQNIFDTDQKEPVCEEILDRLKQ